MQLGKRFILIVLKSVPSVSLYTTAPNQLIQAIKGEEEIPQHTKHFGEEEKRDSTLLCSIRIGSV
jgi:hypothetical protein